MKKINWPALLSLGVTLTGLVAHPAVAALLPEKAAIAVTAIGAALQAVTKAIHDAQPKA